MPVKVQPKLKVLTVTWIRCPKTVYRSVGPIKVGLYDALICTNETYKSRIKVLENLGLEYSEKSTASLEKLQKLQIELSTRRTGNVDTVDDVDDVDDVDEDCDYLYNDYYSPGMHQ